MHKPKIINSILLLVVAMIFGGHSVLAQSNSSAGEKSYESTLYVLIGSDDDAQRGDIPKSLDSVSKQMRSDFPFKNYRLVNTYYGRLASNGSLDYKSLSSLKNVSSELDSPTFLDWQLANFRAEPMGSGGELLSVQLFRFGARVPIVVAQPSQSDGKMVPLTNYESVGLTLNRLTLTENRPTLIGTISLPRTTGTVFLVLVIKAA